MTTAIDDLQARAMAISQAAANRIERQIAREWWLVRKPGGEEVEVFMCPPASQAEMLKRYPGAGVLPRPEVGP